MSDSPGVVAGDARSVAYETDEQAREIVRRYVEDGAPFAVYLRSFELEAYDYLKPATEADPQARLFGVETGGASGLEQRLAGLPVTFVAVANPSRVVPGAVHIPRLRLPDRDWLTVVEWLVRAASFVVLELGALAPGVRQELDAIDRSKRRADTVIVLDETDRFPLERRLLETMGATIPDHPRPDAETLAGYPRVLQGDTFDPTGMADLLAAYDRRTRGEASTETRALRAEFTAFWGLLRINEGAQDDGLRHLFGAVGQFGDLDDRPGIARVLKDIGETYLEAGQYEDAIAAYRDAGSLGSEHDFRYAMCKVAIAHYLAGEQNTAVGYLVAARDQSQQAGDTEIHVYALELLLDIYERAGDAVAVRDITEELRAAR
jgi:tetratricopeptide (TPR) repeat protein